MRAPQIKVSQLIEQLKKMPQNANVFMGYDGNVVVTRAVSVELIENEAGISDCWWKVHNGDVVIFCDGM